MIKGEYGNKIRVWAQEDISANTNILIIRSPRPAVVEKSFDSNSGLLVPDVDHDTGTDTFLAGQYVELKLSETDINISGDWECKLESITPGGEKRIITGLSFSVEKG